MMVWFETILVALTALTGLVWLLDKLFLAKRRAAAAGPLDEVIEQDGARVMIAPMAQMFLFGTEIDYETGLLEAGFKFNNPNVAEACGCGESIKFKDMPAG